jgi:hypothetical protein
MKRRSAVLHYCSKRGHMQDGFAFPGGASSGLLKRFCGVLVCLFGLLSLATTGHASGATPLTKTEQAVLEGVNSGDGTDLGALPDGSISGEFLGRLVAGEIPGTKFRHNGIQLRNALIDGSLDISGQDVRVPFTCAHCEFVDDVDMSDVHFFHSVSFERTAFDHDINMDHAVADGDVDLRDAQFDADVDFSALHVAGSLYVGGAHVNTEGQQASFDHIKVGILAEFSNLELNGPFTLEDAELNELNLGRDISLCKARAENPGQACAEYRTAPSIDLEEATIQRELSLLGVDVDNLYVSGLDVHGRAILQGLIIENSADLRGAHFQYLILANDVSWPDHTSSPESRIQLDGISFSQIEIQDGRNFDNTSPKQYPATDDFYKNMLKMWPDNAGYSARPYQQMEKAFAEAGRPDLADLAYESMKDKERTNGHLTVFQGFGSWVLSLLIRYGREPSRALYASVAFIVLGWIIFRHRRYVDPKDPKNADKTFRPFWYSLDLFLPLSTLPDAEIWEPKEDDWARSFYARFHSVLGWVLIPIGLAAITGLLSGK